MFKLNREQKRNKKANKVSEWIIKSILKLNTYDLFKFHLLINEELHNRKDLEDVVINYSKGDEENV